MKKIFLLVISYFVVLMINAQCVIKTISTDPRNPINSENTILNTFYWFPHNGNNYNSFSARYTNSSGITTGTFNNPYWATSSGPILGLLSLQNLSDFYVKDGWEVIKIDNGYLADNTTQRITAKAMIYFCFYNKYRGIMRFFGIIPGLSGANIIRFKVGMPKFKLLNNNTQNYQNSQYNLNASNTLSIQGLSVQPLDQKTEETSVEVVTQYPGGSPGEHFFWFEIPMAYDPCICKNDVAINLNAQLESSWDLQIKGVLDGKIIQKTETAPNNATYQNLVQKRVIGATLATATAIATGGAVIQVSKFTDLIDILKDKPGVTSSDKQTLTALKTLLNGAGNFVWDEKSGKWKDYATKDSVSKLKWEEIFGQVNTFLSTSIDVLNPGSGGSKTSTTVLANLTATGSATNIIQQGSTIYWGMPGSNWSSGLKEEIEFKDVTGDGVADFVNAEYPLYNYPLGNFALLNTPKVKYKSEILSICDHVDPANNMNGQKNNYPKYTFKLDDNLLFYFNPLLNTNLNRTKIKCAFVIQTAGGRIFDQSKIQISPFLSSSTVCNDDLATVLEQSRTVNLFKNILNEEIVTPFVSIDNFKELVCSITFDKDFHVPIFLKDKLFIRFYIDFESNDNGNSGNKIRNTQVYTFPVEMDTYEPITFPNIIDIVGIDGDKHYSTNTQFTDNKNIVYKGIIKISADLSTTPGVKKRIYSLTGFEIVPNSVISPDIELIVGYPSFTGEFPQPMATEEIVSNFCNNQTINGTIVYRAAQFAEPFTIEDTILEESKVLKPAVNKVDFSLSPNPANNIVQININSTKSENFTISFTDVLGKALFEENKLFKFNEVWKYDITDLNNGVYFVTIGNSHFKSTRKLIVQH
ncbi:MAG: T9SS type A sorting domain-containing protein [Bacteroidota bacterium]|jgi:hypothetical protein